MTTRMTTRPVGRGMAALCAVIAVLQVRPATGAPGDIFSIPAPAINADPPKATDIKDGDASVSTQTGALQYSYPIEVPPGRNGMAPQLALSYSSQAPTYGGVAAGWSLSIPIISEDHSQGRLRTRSAQVEAEQLLKGEDPKRDDRFVSSLAGGRPLVLVTEPTGVAGDVYAAYRAQNDTSFTRYERMVPSAPYRWRARTTDGKVLTFGESQRMPGCTASDQYAPLTGMVDPFGNEPAAGAGLLKPGPHADKSVPATGPRVTKGQKEQLTKIGKKTGCHSCGTKKFGTKSGKPIGDHQPATALKKKNQKQKLYPQCAKCSAKQGAEVRKRL